MVLSESFLLSIVLRRSSLLSSFMIWNSCLFIQSRWSSGEGAEYASTNQYGGMGEVGYFSMHSRRDIHLYVRVLVKFLPWLNNLIGKHGSQRFRFDRGSCAEMIVDGFHVLK